MHMILPRYFCFILIFKDFNIHFKLEMENEETLHTSDIAQGAERQELSG